MVIEFLTFVVRPGARELFIETDEMIWTTFLRRQDGFVQKMVWSCDDPTSVRVVITWKTRDAWKSIPQHVLDQVELEFVKAVPKTEYLMTACDEFLIRR